MCTSNRTIALEDWQASHRREGQATLSVYLGPQVDAGKGSETVDDSHATERCTSRRAWTGVAVIAGGDLVSAR
jgi:hypothetical protein